MRGKKSIFLLLSFLSLLLLRLKLRFSSFSSGVFLLSLVGRMATVLCVRIIHGDAWKGEQGWNKLAQEKPKQQDQPRDWKRVAAESSQCSAQNRAELTWKQESSQSKISKLVALTIVSFTGLWGVGSSLLGIQGKLKSIARVTLRYKMHSSLGTQENGVGWKKKRGSFESF